MEKEDARNQTLEQLHERRKQVVRLHKKGIKIMQIVAMAGLSYPTVRSAIDLFEAGGWNAIRPSLRGRARGDGRVLSQAQEDTIQRMINLSWGMRALMTVSNWQVSRWRHWRSVQPLTCALLVASVGSAQT